MRNFTFKLCLILGLLSIGATSFADVVFKFKTPTGWNNCYLWAWDDNQNQLASSSSNNWPGDAAMTLGSDGYYTYTLKTSVTKVNFLFNNGASSGTKQTVDASTTQTKFMGRYGSTNAQGHYNIIEETFVDTDDSGDDDVVTPDNPQPTGEVTIAAIRSRLSINTNDFTDFAGLYVSALPKAGDATVSYEWQYSLNGSSWAKYSGGDGATWDNIRPNKAGYYRCVISYDLAGVITTITSNTLQITNKGGNSVSFSSNLPVILVRTAKDFPTAGLLDNDGVAALKAKRSVDVKILWNEEGGSVTNADINNADMLHYDRKARMNYRGSSSLYNPKRSYAFVSGDKNCDAKKLGEVKTKKFGMFGAAANKDWVLYASYPDATYMRNVLTYHQYAKMTGLWGAKCRYVELYIDGSYQGIYVFMDKITQDENRVNVNEDTGYIVKFDKTDIADRYSGKEGANEDYKRNTFTTSNTGRTGISTYNITVDQAFEIEYPEREDLSEFDDDGNLVDDSAWDAKVAGVKNRFEEMERAILANDYVKLATIIDYESWADYFIMNEFTKNADAYRISCVFTLNSLEDKIVANPLWDYELGWGNENINTSGLLVEENRYYSDSFPTPFWWTGRGKTGCNGILGDCRFKEIVKERWAKHIGIDGALNSTVLNAKIDSLQAALRGGSAGTSVNTTPLKNWISDRTPALNSVISAWEKCPVPPFVVNPTITDIKCNGENSGSISLEVSGSVAPYTYTWTYPDGTTANTKDISGLTAGSYTLKIEDSIGEIYEQVYEVTEPEALDANISVYNVTCGGYPDGMIGLEMSGGTSPIDFSCYDDQKVLSDIVNLKGGNYSVVLTDANGCTFEKEFYIYEPEKLELVVNSIVEPSEFGASDGFIDITVTGGTGSYKYQWSGYNFEADTEDINNLVSNIYELTVKDENNCAVYERIELSEPAPKPLEVNSYVTNLKCNGENSGSISLEVSGSVPPYTYKWTYPDGTEVNTKDISGLTAGVYTLRIDDSIGESYYRTFQLIEPEALNLSANVKDVTCYGFADGAIDIEVTGGTAPYNYSWDVSNVEDLTNLKGGYYRVTVTDAHGCALEGEYIVTEPEALDVNISVYNVTCGGYPDGMIGLEMSGGTSPIDFSCYDDQKVLSDIVNLKGGNYSVVLTDANGCTFEKEFYIYEPEKLELVVNAALDPSKFGANDGYIDIEVTGGTGSLKYQWQGFDFEAETQDLDGIPGGTYKIDVTDENGCQVSEIIELTDPRPEPYLVNSYVTNLKCNGGNVGSISLEVSGSVPPYTYNWTYPDGTEVNTKDISGLTAGVYTLRIDDSIGESYYGTFEVTEPEALNLSANVKDVTCYGFADGAIDIEVTGGTAPYNYSWDVSNVEDLTNLKGGYYRVTVTDAHGCALEGEYIVTEPTILEATILGETIIPYCEENGTLTAEVRGGVAPYTYKWIEGYDNVISTEKTTSVVNDDAYYLLVYDANGCETESKTFVRFTIPIEIEVNSLIHVGVYGESTGIIEIDAAGGTQPYNYQWSGPGIVNPMNQNQYQLPAGIYSVVVTDDFGCEESKGFEIKQPEITTEAQEFDANVIINVGNGLISVSEGDFAIYNVIGQDVTIYNGGLLPGVYMVQVGDNSTKVIMK